jgi:hypothetical protein
MISGTLLRIWTYSCTATATTSKRIISKTLFIGINAYNESFPQTASYHKTSQRSDNDPKLTAVKEEEGIELDNSIVVTRTKIAEIIAHDYDISRSKAERIIGRIFHEISQVSSGASKRSYTWVICSLIIIVGICMNWCLTQREILPLIKRFFYTTLLLFIVMNLL